MAFSPRCGILVARKVRFAGSLVYLLVMEPSQIMGIRILFSLIGFGVGALFFGTDAKFGPIPLFGWCGIVAGALGGLIAGDPKK